MRCAITNCRGRAPSGDPFCAKHRDKPAIAQPNHHPAQGEGQTAGSGLREAIKRLRFNADFQRGYGDDRFSIRRDDADLILAALSVPEDTPKPQPAEVEQVGDGALREPEWIRRAVSYGCSESEAASLLASARQTLFGEVR